MPFDLANLSEVLSIISAVAVIGGAIFIVFELRQNAKLIDISNKQVEASIQQNKQQVILTLVEHFTDESFMRRRKLVHDIVRKYVANRKWEEFEDSSDDFEVRSFAGSYEMTGYLAKSKMVDVGVLEESMGGVILFDWNSLEPAINHYREKRRRRVFENFEWLAESVKKAAESRSRERQQP